MSQKEAENDCFRILEAELDSISLVLTELSGCRQFAWQSEKRGFF